MNATQIQDFVNKTKPQFLKYKKYLIANDWSVETNDSYIDDTYINDMFSGDLNKVKKAEIKKLMAEQVARQKSNIQYKSEEFKLQNELVKNMLDRIKYLCRKASHSDTKFKSFIKLSLGIVKIHTDRVDTYVNSVDISKIENQEVKSEEIKLMKDCFAGISKINDDIESLNIKDDASETNGIEFLDNQKATIAMYKDLVRLHPEIKEKLDKMGIDFDSPPPPTLHILNPNPPKYDPTVNFWQNPPEIIQYYVDEMKKIDYGVTIDGYYFDGWFYFHFNHFVTKIPTTVMKGDIAENEDVVQIPQIRDNELIITDYFIKSKKEAKMSLIAATRRAAKTTMNASRIRRAQILGKKQILCAGGSAEDLGHINLNIETCNENINPAFRLYYLSPTEDGRGKSYGIKTKSNKSRVTSNVFIINLEGGSKKTKSESLAGFTPDEFILDEAMKFPFKHQLEALEPALWGAGVLRCSVLITGTGGSELLAVDAINMLNDPKANRVTLMDWNTLERNVPPEEITWDNKKDFGLFLPTQMSIKHVKIKTNFSDYLGLDSDYLKNLPIFVTDWKTARENEQKERDAKISEKSSYVRLLAYHPFCSSEIFLSGTENVFPVKEAKAHRDFLKRTGNWDRRRELYRTTDGRIEMEISTRDLAPFPYNGSNIDCPFLIFEDPPKEKVRWGTYTAGMDDYKHQSAQQGSLGTFYVWKNESLGDKFSKRIVASITCRPERHKTFHEKCLLLMEAYQLEGTVFPENEDLSIKDFLDAKHLTEKYLATNLDFTQSFNLPNSNSRRYGWTPQSSKKTIFNLFVDYCNEDFTIEEDGEFRQIKGVQLIDDIWLLEEIIQYTENQNVDRIISAMAGFAFVHYLISSYRWKVRQIQQDIKQGKVKPQKNRNKSFYGGTNRDRNFYRNR